MNIDLSNNITNNRIISNINNNNTNYNRNRIICIILIFV